MNRRKDYDSKASSPGLAIHFPSGKPRIVDGVRQDLVSRVSHQIANDTYDPDGSKEAIAFDAANARAQQELVLDGAE